MAAIYTDIVVRKHPRAKRISFKMSPQGQVVVTIPYSYNKNNLRTLLENSHLKWLRKLLAPGIKQPLTLPRELKLRAINACLPISYNISSTPLLQAYLYKDEVHVDTPNRAITDYKAVHNTFHPVMRELGKNYLVPWLKELSQKHDLPIRKVTIRGQRGRWGSCTENKDISLNYKLLFLPQPMAEHVMLHELSHTIVMDHSEKFWRVLAQLDPEYEAHDRALRTAQNYLPFFLRH